MNTKVRSITEDAIFLALLIVLVVLFKYVFSVMDIMIPILISLFLAIRYHKIEIMRQVIVSIALLGISFILMDPVSILAFIVPGVILGFISHFTVRIFSNVPYFLLTIPTYFLIDTIDELLYSKLIMNMGIKEYLYIGMEFPESWIQNLGLSGLIIIFIAYNLVMAIMESMLLRLGVFAYERLLLRIKRH